MSMRRAPPTRRVSILRHGQFPSPPPPEDVMSSTAAPGYKALRHANTNRLARVPQGMLADDAVECRIKAVAGSVQLHDALLPGAHCIGRNIGQATAIYDEPGRIDGRTSTRW
jgi:hypothetical protein